MSSGNDSRMSRLAQIQLKFQQKQQQEQEKRKQELASKAKLDSLKPTSLGSSTARSVGNGRVRQMFDDRRRGAGFDKSNLLKPISSDSSKESTTTPHFRANSYGGVTSVNTVTAATKPSLSRGYNTARKSVNTTLKLDDIKSTKSVEDLNNNFSSKPTASVGKTKNDITLKPVVVKKTPTKQPPSPVKTPTSASRASKSVTPTATNNNINNNNLSAKSSAMKISLSNKPPPRVVTPPPGMATCQFCSRNFNIDRLEKHQEVCQKINTKQRKIFDATKQRVQGTEVEVYAKKSVRGITVVPTKSPPTKKKSNWRIKHEEFIATIRNAKKVTAHLAKGGNIADLPPPPVSSNPDYVQCPHCSRRFNEAAAERHIPKCANMRHNKPKPAARK